MNLELNQFFENLGVRHLIGNYNECDSGWAETNCSYAYHKFYYFMGGVCSLSCEGIESYPQQGDLYLIPAGTVHSYSHNQQNPGIQYWSHFDMELGGGRSLSYNKKSLKVKLPQSRVEPLFSRLVHPPHTQGFLKRIDEKVALMELLSLFISEVDHSLILKSESTGFITRMKNYIQSHLQDEMNLEDLAEVVHLQKNYFIHQFKKSFGMTPIEYINHQRLLKATQLMSEQEGIKIAEVAELSGFKDYRYFSRLFRRYYGMTPSAFKQMKSMDLPPPL